MQSIKSNCNLITITRFLESDYLIQITCNQLPALNVAGYLRENGTIVAKNNTSGHIFSLIFYFLDKKFMCICQIKCK